MEGVRERRARKVGSAMGQINIGIDLFSTHTNEWQRSEVVKG